MKLKINCENKEVIIEPADNLTVSELKHQVCNQLLTECERLSKDLEDYIFILNNTVLENNSQISDLNNLSELWLVESKEFEKSKPCRAFKLPVVEQFEHFTQSTPNKIAIISGIQTLTYQQLNGRVNQIANFLLAQGFQDSVIAVSGKSKLQMIFSQLAILKVNSTFVMLDTKDPDDRTQFILNNSQAKLVLHCGEAQEKEKLEKKFPSLRIINLNQQEYLAQSMINPSYSTEQINPAYLLYTSGSTGQPKGVIQTQQNIQHQITHYTRDMEITSNDRLLQLATLSHDQAIVDIYGALLNGATLVLSDIQGNKEEVLTTIKQQNVSIFSSIPSMFRSLFEDTLKGDFPHLRIITIGGEETTLTDAELFQKIATHQHCQLINGYGATECSWVSYFKMGPNEKLENFKSFPLGYITQGIEVCIDTEGHEVGGELLICGEGVSPGYWNNDEENKKAFKIEHNRQYYRTGDIVKIVTINEQDCYEFLGRAKWHSKINGKRVNLNEIEKTFDNALSFPGTTVLAIGTDKKRRLVAFVPGKTDELDHRIALINKALSSLPTHMIPKDVIHIHELPKLPNGKTNRHALEILYKEENNQILTSQLMEENEPFEPIQKVVFNAWKKVLNCPINEATKKETFFYLGGSSQDAMTLINLIRNYCEQEHDISPEFSVPEVFGSNLEQFTLSVQDKVKQQCRLIAKYPDKPFFSRFYIFDSENFKLTSTEYYSLQINFASFSLLAQKYNLKYDIDIRPCPSYNCFVDTIRQELNVNAKRPVHIGLTLPQNNRQDAHPTPCILYIGENNQARLLVSDSLGPEANHWRVPIIKSLLEKENITIQIITDSEERQDDSHSCSIDALIFLSSALRCKLMENIEINAHNEVTKKPVDIYKTYQKSIPEHVDRFAPFLNDENKNLEKHLNKYYRSIHFFHREGSPLPTEKKLNVFSYEKSKKYGKALKEAAVDNTGVYTYENITKEIKIEPKHTILGPKKSAATQNIVPLAESDQDQNDSDLGCFCSIL